MALRYEDGFLDALLLLDRRRATTVRSGGGKATRLCRDGQSPRSGSHGHDTRTATANQRGDDHRKIVKRTRRRISI